MRLFIKLHYGIGTILIYKYEQKNPKSSRNENINDESFENKLIHLDAFRNSYAGINMKKKILWIFAIMKTLEEYFCIRILVKPY